VRCRHGTKQVSARPRSGAAPEETPLPPSTQQERARSSSSGARPSSPGQLEADGPRQSGGLEPALALPFATLHVESAAQTKAIYDAAGVGVVDVHRLPAADASGGLVRINYQPDRVGARMLLERLKAAQLQVRLPACPGAAIRVQGFHAQAHQAQVKAAFLSAIGPGVAGLVILAATMVPGVGDVVMSSEAMRVGTLVVVAALAAWAVLGSQAGLYFWRSASRALRHGAFTMDVLVGMSTSVVVVYGVSLAVYAIIWSDSGGDDMHGMDGMSGMRADRDSDAAGSRQSAKGGCCNW